METFKPLGKLDVGVLDLQWLGSDDITPDNVDPTKHLFGRLYYPADTRAYNSFAHRFLPPAWLPSFYNAYGLANFIFFRRPKGLLYWIAKQCVMILAAVFGTLQRVNFYPDAPLATDHQLPSKQLPVVIFSHGLGGYRACYSIPCSELASQGYIVFAIEHADGSASCAKLAGNKGWRFYKGLGGDEGQVNKTRHRVQEMKTAYKVLHAMHHGDALPGELSFSLSTTTSSWSRSFFSLFSTNKNKEKKDPSTFLHGRLDMNCVAAAGHSYGAATTAALISEDPHFHCGICLDPWWPALPAETAALSDDGWKTKTPLLIMGSHDWNVPNINGEYLCDEKRQAKVLNAARQKQLGDGGSMKKKGKERTSTTTISTNTNTTTTTTTGAGALLLVLAGSSHNTFVDPLALFSEHMGWVLRALGLTARLDPLLGMYLVNISMLAFLSTHLQLTQEQRSVQSWSPLSNVHKGLDKISELDEIIHHGNPYYYNRKNGSSKNSKSSNGSSNGSSNNNSSGVLSWLFPGRGLIYGVSDYFMDLVLETSIGKKIKKKKERHNTNKKDNNGNDELDDVVSATEILETVMPSSEPAAGLHPHAPSQIIGGKHHGMTLRKRKQSSSEEESGQKERSLAELRLKVGSRYVPCVQSSHVDEYVALLGEKHVFLCESHV